MELIAEIKLEGDGYAGGFSCGLSMCRSKTIENFKKVNETETKICYENAEGVLLTVYKQKENEKPVLLNSDYYKPKKQVVKVGTKKAVTEEKENND